jgi:hypothetical protein
VTRLSPVARTVTHSGKSLARKVQPLPDLQTQGSTLYGMADVSPTPPQVSSLVVDLTVLRE